MEPFDLLGPLPSGPTTTVLEASAGTGKTYTLAALVTRYVAEGRATLDEMLLITFGRAASQELRERVRDQLLVAAEALADPDVLGDDADELLRHLVTGSVEELSARRDRLRDALAGFDAATIATTHQFCQLVLRSLGVAGDTDAGVTLVESLDELVTEVVDDLYLQRFGNEQEKPAVSRAEALLLAREVVANPRAVLTPLDPPAGSTAAVRYAFAADVLAELERRKRRLGVLGFDDLLGRLAVALEGEDAPARVRMRQRWRIVMVDEFQDTDPVQWDVIERAFVGHTTVVLIGDPKQAIYAFRGGDISTYLRAAGQADHHRTLATNWRSDRPLVERLQKVLQGAALGHPDIVVRPVEAQRSGQRLAGAPVDDPFRLRVVTREKFGLQGTRTIAMDELRPFVAADLAADVKRLLASGASYDGRPLVASDIAVIVEAHKDARVCRDALAEAGVPAVYTGDSDVFASQAAADWLCLLEAFEQPHRSGLVRAAASTMFFGKSAADLAAGGDRLTDQVADTLRQWADHVRERGIAVVLEAALVAGLAERVLTWRGGERHMTDLAHVGQLLHETAHRDRLGLPALLDWLRTQCDERGGAGERNRRLDSDAAAVQIMTVWVSKGLQYPLVYLPFAFNRYLPQREVVLYHHDDERRLDIGGKSQPGFRTIEARGRAEMAGDDIRLTYVALTRAQSQVVAWWAPSWDEPNGGLSRLLRGRGPGQAEVPDRCEDKVEDVAALTQLRRWESVGGPSIEQALLVAAEETPPGSPPTALGVRRFDRSIDLAWRRTSYSGLIRAAEELRGVTSEPEVGVLDDEADGPLPVAPTPTPGETVGGLVSPMADLPAGATFGSLVHGVLEHADPHAPDLVAELAARVREQLAWWPVEAGVDDLASGLVPLHRTPLGPLAPGLTLGDVGLGDRLRELDFEIPLAGGDHATGPRVVLADIGALLRRHLPAGDPLLPYSDRLTGPGLAEESLRGYLTGSIDVVLRVPGEDGSRYLVVDYKTNRLGTPDAPLTSDDYRRDQLTAAMLHSDYPLQALLYTVVVHRYLRWRQPGYDPAIHLGGVLYLYVRGMCGPETPLDDGHPAGVFSWTPPPSLVTALSDLLDGVTS
ncbi:UvrD-helicase domain-containing protein [Nocardioides sp. W7]|uniref:UvrD-helicase domain-containing protein n=1 Tax=Nocardioides sp. W7 TaxID=2931390 RepID=UPI001FD072D6|nr:UvrD-helicase domain-containing protein [Nocardioides sp. W7]